MKTLLLASLALFVPHSLPACTVGQFAELQVGQVSYSDPEAAFSVCRIGFGHTGFSVGTDVYLKGLRLSGAHIFSTLQSPDLSEKVIAQIQGAPFVTLPTAYQFELPDLHAESYWDRAFVTPPPLTTGSKAERAPFSVSIGDGQTGHSWSAELAQSDGKTIRLKSGVASQKILHWIMSACGVHYLEARPPRNP